MEKIRSESSRISEAYLLMASGAKYRPAAPCDVFDNVTMTGREIKDPNRFREEAAKYTGRFIEEEDSLAFQIGKSNFRTGRAFVYTIEAARNLCDGKCGAEVALKLLKMAQLDLQQALDNWQ